MVSAGTARPANGTHPTATAHDTNTQINRRFRAGPDAEFPRDWPVPKKLADKKKEPGSLANSRFKTGRGANIVGHFEAGAADKQANPAGATANQTGRTLNAGSFMITGAARPDRQLGSATPIQQPIQCPAGWPGEKMLVPNFSDIVFV